MIIFDIYIEYHTDFMFSLNGAVAKLGLDRSVSLGKLGRETGDRRHIVGKSTKEVYTYI